MTSRWSRRTLDEEFLVRADDDWVSVGEVVDMVRESRARRREDLRDLSIGLIAKLMVRGLIVPGDVGSDGFVAWTSSPGEAMVRIVEEWTSRSNPFVLPGEVAWFEITEAGQEIADAVWRREGSS